MLSYGELCIELNISAMKKPFVLDLESRNRITAVTKRTR